MKTLAILALLCASRLIAAEIPRLEWDANPEPDVIGYTVFWGPGARSYTNSVQITNRLTTRFDLKCFAPGAYFFSLKARDSEGLESDFSNEVIFAPTNATPCAPAAPALRITIPVQSSVKIEGPWRDTQTEITLLAEAESHFYRLGPMQISRDSAFLPIKSP